VEPESRECACDNDESSLDDLFAIIRKRRLVVLLCVLVVLGAVAAYVYRSPNVYRISNIIVLDQGTMLEMGDTKGKGKDIFHDVYLDLEDVFLILGDSDLLMKMKSQDLSLDKRTLSKILEVKATPFKMKGIQDVSAVQIDVTALDTKAGASFIEYMPQYICSRPLIRDKIESSKRQLLKNIDDLQSIKDDPIKALHISGNPVIIGPEIFSIYEKYNQYREMLEKIERLQIVRLAGDTFIPVEPYGPKKALIIAAGLFAGLLFGICLAFVVERISASSPKE